jgi:hypothetical protein
MPQSLHYLVFDVSEDADATTTWDAMASVSADRVPALAAEAQAVLRWAQTVFGPAAPLDEGGAWDFDLHAHDDAGQPLPVQWQADAASLHLGAAGQGRTTLTLAIGGGEGFAEAMREAWALDE